MLLCLIESFRNVSTTVSGLLWTTWWMRWLIKKNCVQSWTRSHVSISTFRCFYLESGEAVALVAGQLCVDEFSEKKLPELWSLKTTAHLNSSGSQLLNVCSCQLYLPNINKVLSHLLKDWWIWERWAKRRHVFSCCDRHLSINQNFFHCHWYKC